MEVALLSEDCRMVLGKETRDLEATQEYWQEQLMSCEKKER